MTHLHFKDGDIFDYAIGKHDLTLFYGQMGMAFGLGYNFAKEKYQKFAEIHDPFETHANIPIEYEKGKFLVCIPAETLSDEEMQDSLVHWLNYAKQNNLHSLALDGCRDSSKDINADISEREENDNNRVRFIVELTKKWIAENPSTINEVMFIAMSNNFTRNYPEPLTI